VVREPAFVFDVVVTDADWMRRDSRSGSVESCAGAGSSEVQAVRVDVAV
jgi:hypothetical protein